MFFVNKINLNLSVFEICVKKEKRETFKELATEQ